MGIFFRFKHPNMGSVFLLKVRICFMPPQLTSTARFLCTKDIKPNLGGRQVDRNSTGQTRIANRNNRQVTESGTSSNSKKLWQNSYPKSVFAAGTAKRTAELMRQKAPPVSEEEEQQGGEDGCRTATRPGKLQAPERPLPPAEWKKLKESFGNPERFDIRMMSTLIASGSELNIAKSLLSFVAVEVGTLSYELLLRYLKLCESGGHDDEVFDVYRIMRGSFPSLDTGASSLFIKSFSRTARWKEAIEILQEVKKVFTPSPRNYGDVIAASVHHRDATTAWDLYDELIEKGLSPHQETWDVLFTGVKQIEGEKEMAVMSESEQHEKLLGILMYMRNNQIYPQQTVVNRIKNWFESLNDEKWTADWSSVTPKGLCSRCGSELESIQLSAEEYQELKDRVMADIIQGQDVFNKTTPEELERFKVFVKRKPAFDVVIDGLNVANTNKDKSKQSETLLTVVSELERQGLNVLVLGRKHMLRPSRSWDRHNMSLIQQKAHCFFTDNISEDDPFLLYATLHSGNHCRFVSRDLMRDHKACLPGGATRRLFFKWQRGHQLVVVGYVAPGRRVRFQSIPSFDTIVQSTADSWHIPYDDTEDRSTYEVPQQWLCLTKNK
ncbi:PREDICTED: mitochondrial ribonuclease P protein 3 [Cyprinodon variegatus]|uniref:Mitochondrial ribonuclease P catalytic subunit n=1 Tax=Cyprinodon variegatus TaxID=28743 RepID=A0A3Q2CAV0_CYPVA|nr:PREDICTED: mitochondrial ribonuclease P protein 3 [Cyprinodon variegatus]